jgi:CO/xanthine dehydrogenase Mo-binding subunit
MQAKHDHHSLANACSVLCGWLPRCFTLQASTLNIPASKIQVVNTRVGGAYGGKAFMHISIAAMTCVAAIKLGKYPPSISLAVC